VCACVSSENQIPFIGRKDVLTQNVMAIYSFDMQFTFVWAGWEGSAHDTRIFLEAIDNPHIKFSKPLEGSNVCMCVYIYMLMLIVFWHFSFQKIYMYLQGYYLVDSGYPNEYGFLDPYRG
jgi:hypothetical protein